MHDHASAADSAAIVDQVRQQIEAGIPGAQAEVHGEGGHFLIKVVAEQFEGLNTLKKQQLVYATIKDLMAGAAAPVHAVDRMITLTPSEAGRASG